ncbi:MAG: lysylphosphatidylglycerol synthase transmembrane domain-containing protein [Gemmatimonadales bacterium]
MKLWIKIAVSAGLLTIIFLLLPWGKVLEALHRLPGEVWLGAAAGFVAGHFLGVFKWRLFVNAGRAALGVVYAVHGYAAGLFANLCLPSIVGGDVLRMALAGKFTRRPEAALWGGVMDRLTDVTALALLVAAGGILSRGTLPGWGRELLTVGLVLGAVVAAVFLPLLLRRPLAWWPRRIRRHVARSLVSLRHLARRPAIALGGLTISLTVQGSFVLINAWLGHGIGVNVPLAAWFLAWPLAKVVSLMPISLGGLAVREASLAAFLAPFGVPLELGVLTSLLWQSVLISGGLTGGLVWLLLSRRRDSRSNGVAAAASTSTAHA